MYTSYFNLREIPFSIAPDPAFLYMSPRHQEALGHLLYGTGQYGGFVQLTGEVGTGKTTIIRTLLAQKLDKVNVAMIHNPRQSEREFVQSICDELGIAYDRSNATLKTLVDALNGYLLSQHEQGRRTVLIIDEAQQLAPEVLEQVRLLTNLETSKEKLLRIMLIGQPELAELLARQDMRQLAQRITARYHLTPLSGDETAEYIGHRLQVAGGARDIFTPAAVRSVHRYSQGIPRLVNIICDRALLGAYSQSLRLVTPEIVTAAAQEALGLGQPSRAARRSLPSFRLPAIPLPAFSLRWLELGLACVGLVIALLLLLQHFSEQRLPSPKLVEEVAVVAPEPEPSTVPAVAPRAAPRAAPKAVPTAPPSAKPVAASRPPVAVAKPPLAKPVIANTAVERLKTLSGPLNSLMTRLGRLWLSGYSIGKGEKACRALHRQRLECLKGSAEWSDLSAMNAPAILTLSLGKGDVRYVLLRALGNEQATLLGEQGETRIALAELDPLWTGEYLLLWRRETDEVSIGPDTRGEPVQWLRRRLAERLKIPVGNPDDGRWDEELKAALKKFQTAQGIRPDGIARARSLLALADPRGAPVLKK